MSQWTHALCQPCWDELQGDRVPYRLVDTDEETCCRCGAITKSGIYYRADPQEMKCRGVIGYSLVHVSDG